MAQYQCPVCGEGFEQRSAYRRHMQTSHPEQAPSAADMEGALAGIGFPATRDELVRHAREGGHDDIAALLEELPARRYRDAAEVARAFGELRSHQHKPDHQPGARGGRRALESLSAARVAALLEGIEFPATRQDLVDHVHARASDSETAAIRRLPERTYHDMSDVARAFGESHHRSE